MFGLFEKNKYTIIFLKKVNGIFDRVGSKGIKSSKSEVKFGKSATAKTFIVDFTNVIYKKGTKHFIFMDIDKGQIFLKGDDEENTMIPAEVIDAFVNKHIISQLVSRLGGGQQLMGLMVAIIILLVGILGGYFLGNVVTIASIQQAVSHIHF
jgi:hypothetical protein